LVEGVDSVRIGVVVPAAGSGERMGGVRKAFLELDGQPLLLHSLRPFLSYPGVESIVVALAESDALAPPSWLSKEDPRIRIVSGGATRGESVVAALSGLDSAIGVVLVHDAARPLVTHEIIGRCVNAVRDREGAIAGWPVVDTLKEVDDGELVLGTPDRSRIRGAQTPQAFPRSGLIAGYRTAREAGVVVTDDAQAFALAGGKVRVVAGSQWNFKVTHPEDVAVAEFLLRRRRGG
jgi:2-C-methyl-D-erythritol 4-phosphate cytidylyltransferase